MVTGGNGLVGKRLVQMLAERGAQSVVSLDLALPADVDSLNSHGGRVRWATGDITSVEQMTSAFREARATCVFHVAALVGPDFEAAAYERVNHQGAQRRCKQPHLILTCELVPS